MPVVFLVLWAIFRSAGVIKFVPYPVTAGFTAGIGAVILVSQIKDVFGLTILTPQGAPPPNPADVVGKLQIFPPHWRTFSWQSPGIALRPPAVLSPIPPV